ncbi:hypothetical protein [Streptomyces roseicoloratus]|uniref:hypothetical protein n=1 Tax=Streptomyces roseicoloratus TaxID=2508722 RepID=UPI001009DD89|nr:hypothetical protein [Streptomyces roseicoloratus]
MSERTDQPPNVHSLLGKLADRIEAKHPTKAIDERLVLAQALVVAEHTYGPTEAADAAERALIDALPPVRPDDTRAEYATRCRLVGQEVSA